MTQIKLLGIGCSRCRTLRQRVNSVAERMENPPTISVVSDINEMLKYDIRETPALVINDQVFAEGNPPSEAEIFAILTTNLGLSPQKGPQNTILVATDFSPASKKAIQYAAHLAQLCNARLRLLHCITVGTAAVNTGGYVPPVDRLEQLASIELDKCLENLAVEHVAQEIQMGSPGTRILEAAEDVDCIVLGTTGATGAIGRLFGSVATQVSRGAKCPVFLVPNSMVVKPIQQVLIGMDAPLLEKAKLQALKSFLTPLSAKPHFVRVAINDEEIEAVDNTTIEAVFLNEAPSQAYQFTVTCADTVAQGLRDYARRHQIDLTILLRHHRSLFQQLVHHSVTNEMALNPEQALLVFG